MAPRLLAGWHIGMTDVEKARLEHQEAKQKRKMQSFLLLKLRRSWLPQSQQ
jgi:hypothetical protein